MSSTSNPNHFKDHFSKQATHYAQFRPTYPKELFNRISQLASAHHSVWDVGTGNGQAALGWIPHFDRIWATDASLEQIAKAQAHPKINYRICAAENAIFIASGSIDLVSVAQALHWFQFDAFYKEVARVATTDAIIAAWCYNLFTLSKEIDDAIYYYYEKTVGPFWPMERHFIDDDYRSIPFPFTPLPFPPLEMQRLVNLEQVLGYLKTWSATVKARATLKRNPMEEIEKELPRLWGDPWLQKKARYRLTVKVGRIQKKG